jgi:ribosomal protein S6--L-glutamate ligase
MRKIGTLGDFPVIVKVMGGSHGVGVIRVDSEESLRSLSDYLFATKVTFVVKEYFTVRSSLRLVVVGNTVVDAIQYMVPVGDFRSNVGEFPVVVKVVPSKVSISLALRAVASLGLDFGGVDILVTDKRNYITEVNFPCFFPRCQLLTGTDIAGMMIDFLIEKSKKLLQ